MTEKVTRLTPQMVTLLAQQAFHDVMHQALPYGDEPGTYCIGDADEDEQAEQIAMQFEALLYAALGIEGGPGALPSLPPHQWPGAQALSQRKSH